MAFYIFSTDANTDDSATSACVEDIKRVYDSVKAGLNAELRYRLMHGLYDHKTQRIEINPNVFATVFVENIKNIDSVNDAHVVHLSKEKDDINFVVKIIAKVGEFQIKGKFYATTPQQIPLPTATHLRTQTA